MSTCPHDDAPCPHPNGYTGDCGADDVSEWEYLVAKYLCDEVDDPEDYTTWLGQP